MFQIIKQHFGSLTSYKLQNQESNLYCICIPEFGANIIELQLENDGKSIQIVDGFKSEAQLRSNEKSRGIHLAPFPNRIEDGIYSFEGNTYHLPINKRKEHNAIHGFIWDKPFKVIEEKAREDFASLSLAYNYEGDLDGYPFPLEIKYAYKLSQDGLSIAVTATNTGDSKMPFGVGWHPYFTFDKPVDQLQLQLPDCNKLEVDERMIPTGAANHYQEFEHLTSIDSAAFDTALRLLNSGNALTTKLFDPAENTSIILTQDLPFPYLQVYIPPDRNSIALEPMSCPANAFNSGEGLVVLKPGEKFEGKIKVQLTV